MYKCRVLGIVEPTNMRFRDEIGINALVSRYGDGAAGIMLRDGEEIRAYGIYKRLVKAVHYGKQVAALLSEDDARVQELRNVLEQIEAVDLGL